MTRTVLSGGRVFDGTGSPIADADVVISDGKITDLGERQDRLQGRPKVRG